MSFIYLNNLFKSLWGFFCICLHEEMTSFSCNLILSMWTVKALQLLILDNELFPCDYFLCKQLFIVRKYPLLILFFFRFKTMTLSCMLFVLCLFICLVFIHTFFPTFQISFISCVKTSLLNILYCHRSIYSIFMTFMNIS